MESPGRRRFLQGCVAVAGAAVLPGCLRPSQEVEVLAAGSLAVLLGGSLGPRFERKTGARFSGEFRGSRVVTRMVREGQRRPDAVVCADAELLRRELYPELASWDVVFASNALGIAYDPETEIGRRLEEGEEWYRVLPESDGGFVRSDPELDPLGYRTVQMFELAEGFYGAGGLASRLRRVSAVEPDESHLLAQVEAGERSAAFCYRNMASDHGLPFLELPDELDFSNPDMADRYSEAVYVTEGGQEVRGRPILYGATVPSNAPSPGEGKRFLRFLLESRELLEGNGLIVRDSFPSTNGEVPEGVLP